MDRLLGLTSCAACALVFVLFGCGDDAQQAPNGDGDGEDGGNTEMSSSGRGGPMRPRLDASTTDGPTFHLRDGGASGSGGRGTVDAGVSDPACADDDPCTIDTRGSDGECANDPVVCTALDPCHAPGQCNPATGVCSDPRRSDDTPCDDDDACTQTDRCVSGACVGTNPVICTAQDQCHDPGTCDRQSGECSDRHKSNGTPCDDGNDCTLDDACSDGVCKATPPVISCDGTQCAPASYLGDNDCDEPLLCAANNYDNGDCACGGNPGYATGCDGVTCHPVSHLGDGVCDLYLVCYGANYDNGDCGCDGDWAAFRGCDGSCYPADWIGDNDCDAFYNCAATNFDNGDCP